MLSKAKAQFSRLIRAAQQQPQLILRHGQPVALVTAFRSDLSLNPSSSSVTALEALRGDFDFTALPKDDWIERDRRTEVRDLDWGGELSELR